MRTMPRLMLAFLLALSTSPCYPDGDSDSRLRLARPANADPSRAAFDPNDDLGDFVATYAVRHKESHNTPGVLKSMWGEYTVARRGNWMSISMSLEQEVPTQTEGVTPMRHTETWVFCDNRFEGLIENNILTLDPSYVGMSHPVPPFYPGLGWALDFSDRLHPAFVPPSAESARRLASGFGDDVLSGSAEQGFTRTMRSSSITRTLEDGTSAPLYSELREPARNGLPSGGRFLRKEVGYEVPPGDSAPGFRVPVGVVEVPEWRDKFPARIVSTSYRMLGIEDSGSSTSGNPTRAQMAAAAEQIAVMGRGSIISETIMDLTNVREPRDGDRIEMRDWARTIAAIRDGNHGVEPEPVQTTDAQTLAASRRWRLDENSQQWERVAAY